MACGSRFDGRKNHPVFGIKRLPVSAFAFAADGIDVWQDESFTRKWN